MRLIKRLILIVALLISFNSDNLFSQSLTASQVVDKVSAKLTQQTGLSADFNYYGEGIKGKGKIQTSGKKFHVAMPDVEIWYNGKDLYTYNKRVGETTVVNPTMEELAESNPLLYINTEKNKFTSSHSKQKLSGRYIVELTPPNKEMGLKKLLLTVRNADFAPEKIEIVGINGQSIIFELTSFKTGISQTASYFTYPKEKLKEVEIVDLR